ncbi:MAG: hypothetical protein HKN50_07625 [Gammaproteobacteria bacterium]|nr:hypothetical protein [Gammaproteobacteria bacterium]
MPDAGAAILIVEDDPEQMRLFVNYAVTELKALLKDPAITAQQRAMLTPFNILQVGEMKSLQQAVMTGDEVVMAILDCNIPDASGELPNDQFVMQDKHKVTGQHKSVDLIACYLPGTPITLTSSMRRFQRTITRFYASQTELQLDFISKDDIAKMQTNIGYHLRAHIAQGS